jgi:two-component system sensor histidine kinase PhcS
VASALHVLRTKKERIPEPEREQYNEVVADIEEGIRRVQRIVSDLRTFTHPKSGGLDRIQLEEAVTTSLRFLSHEMKDLVKPEILIAPGQTVLADRNKLLQVLINLVQNASDALREKRFEEGAPELSIVSAEGKGRVTLRIRDNGTGIKREDMGKIFDPFFTTKDVGKGMGLGLSVCYRLMHEMDGAISVSSERGKFTEFSLELPARDQ